MIPKGILISISSDAESSIYVFEVESTSRALVGMEDTKMILHWKKRALRQAKYSGFAMEVENLKNINMSCNSLYNRHLLFTCWKF